VGSASCQAVDLPIFVLYNPGLLWPTGRWIPHLLSLLPSCVFQERR
jgi:hypothetical protein